MQEAAYQKYAETMERKIYNGRGDEFCNALSTRLRDLDPRLPMYHLLRMTLMVQRAKMRTVQEDRRPSTLQQLNELVELLDRLVVLIQRGGVPQRDGICLLVLTPREADRVVTTASFDGVDVLWLPRSMARNDVFAQTLLGRSVVGALGNNIKDDVWTAVFATAVCYVDAPESFSFYNRSACVITGVVRQDPVTASRLAKQTERLAASGCDDTFRRALAGSMRRCATCKKNSTAALKCGGCQKVYYCNKTCQLADWGSHKTLCASNAKQRAK